MLPGFHALRIPQSTNEITAASAVVTSLNGKLSLRRLAGVPALGLLVCMLGGMHPSRHAERLTPKDLQLAGWALQFTDMPLSGTVNLAIVYAQDVPGSEDEARAAASWLSRGLQVGKLLLMPVPVEQSSLVDLQDYVAIITAEGVYLPVIRDAMRQHHVPCLTTHLSQVQDGGCLVGLRSLPAASIQLNSSASASAGIRFATAFRMMVQEVRAP